MPQNVSYRSMLKATGIYSVGTLAAKLVGFVLIPIYTKYLSPADYGVLELLDLTADVLLMLSGTRLGQALFYYHFKAPDEEARNSHVTTAFLGSCILGLAVASLAGLIGPILSLVVFGTRNYTWYLQLVMAALVFRLPAEIGFCAVRAFNRSTEYVILSVLSLVISCTLNIIFLAHFHMGVVAVLWSSIISSGSVTGYMAWTIFSRLPARFRWSLFTQQVRYALPLGASGLGDFTLHFGDRFFLRPAVPLSQLGIYSLAYKFGMTISSFVHLPFNLYWSSQVVRIVESPDGEKKYVRVSTYLMLVLTTGAVLLSLFIRPVVAVMADPAYHESARYVPWIAAIYVVRAIGAHLRYIFVVEKRTELELYVTWFGAGLCFAAYALLIPRLKLWGAVLATGLAFASILVASIWKAQRVRRMNFEVRRMVQVALCGAIAVVPSFLFHPGGLWQQTAIGVCFTAVYLGLLLITGFVNRDEWEAIRHLGAATWERCRKPAKATEIAPN